MRRIAGYSLWLGHIADARNAARLHETGILAAIDLALDESPFVLLRDLTYCRFPLVDGQGNPAWLLRIAMQTVARLVRENIPTLVFCGSGMSRSPCIAAGAIAQIRRCPIGEGIALVLESGPSDVTPGLWIDVQAAFEVLNHEALAEVGHDAHHGD